MMDIEMRAGTAAQPITLALMGDVGWDITAQNVALALKGVPKGTPLTISINSYGGDALAGIAVHNILARHEGQKRVVIEGIAASAASLIAMAGDEIIMPENAFMMVHEAWGGALGDSETMRQQADVLDKISGAYRRTYAARSGQTEEAVAALMAAETWFTAEDAVTNGFATEAAAPAEIRAFASLSPDRYARTPEALRRLVQAAKAAPVAETVFNPPAIPPAVAKEVGMSESIAPAGGNTPAPSAAPVQAVAVQPISASVADLEGIAGRNGLPADFVVAQIKAGATREAALEAALEAVAQKSPQSYAPARVIRDEAETRSQMAGHALSYMAGQRLTAEEAEMAGHMRGWRAIDLARDSLVRAGARHVNQSPYVIAQAALGLRSAMMSVGLHTTSDFSLLLANTASKSLRVAYNSAPRTFLAWANRATLPDFKTMSRVALGGAPQLLAVREHGEIEFGTIGEASETYSIARYTRRVGVTFEAIINDDLSGISRVPVMFGSAASRLESEIVYGILNANGNMADGIALFNASHANVSTGALSVASIGAARANLRKQTAPNGDILNLTGNILLVPADLETAALSFMANNVVPSSASTTAVNPWANTMQVVPEPRLSSATQWYLMATPDQIDTVEYAYLRGMEEPQITSYSDEDTDGLVIKATHCFGAKAIDWRGMNRSSGA
jgi:ATP-dependent protease ClpP protease subunit